MISFYSILFSISIKIDTEASESFSIVPTVDCKDKLKRLGLIFKSKEDGCLILIERVGEVEATAEPLRKILNLSDFVFALHLNKPGLMEQIRPYKRVTPFPDFIGRSRKLYFNNLNVANTIDDTRTDLTSMDGEVSDDDFSSITLNKFGKVFTNPAINQVTLNELKPGAVLHPPYILDPQNRTVKFELEKGAYKLEQRNGIISSETIFAQSELVRSSALGIIQIFKDETIQYTVPVNYEIQFIIS